MPTVTGEGQHGSTHQVIDNFPLYAKVPRHRLQGQEVTGLSFAAGQGDDFGPFKQQSAEPSPGVCDGGGGEPVPEYKGD